MQRLLQRVNEFSTSLVLCVAISLFIPGSTSPQSVLSSRKELLCDPHWKFSDYTPVWLKACVTQLPGSPCKDVFRVSTNQSLNCFESFSIKGALFFVNSFLIIYVIISLSCSLYQFPLFGLFDDAKVRVRFPENVSEIFVPLRFLHTRKW